MSLGLLFATLSMLAACGGSTPPPELPAKDAPPAPPPPAPPPPPSAEPAPSASAEPESGPPPPPAPSKPKSKATIAGQSISDVEGKTVVEAMQKIGWAPQEVEIGGGTVGKYEYIRFTLEKNGVSGHVEIVRFAHNPREGASMMSPAAQLPSAEKRGAAYLDKDADVIVIVVIDGRQAVAKQVLEKLVETP